MIKCTKEYRWFHHISKRGIAEGHQYWVLLIKHDIQHALAGQTQIDSVNIILIPVKSILFLLIEVLMTLLHSVRCYICVQVMNVMVLDSICEGFEQFWDVEEGTSFNCSFGEIPFLLVLSVGHVDCVLQMEENGSDSLSYVQTEIHFPSR